jgi:hypothetical protein
MASNLNVSFEDQFKNILFSLLYFEMFVLEMSVHCHVYLQLSFRGLLPINILFIASATFLVFIHIIFCFEAMLWF